MSSHSELRRQLNDGEQILYMHNMNRLNPSTPLPQSPPAPPGIFVSVILRNGFGNRIIQILAALAYAEKNNKVCVICKSLITRGMKSHEQNLETQLSKVFPNLITIDRIDKFTIIREEKEMNYSQLPNSISNVVLQGYFQDERYFPSKSLIPVIRTAYYENTYFIHIRAGDYLDPGSFGIDLRDYHKQCIAICSKTPEIKYLVFSNDNNYADNYMKQFGIEYTISDKVDPFEALVEMSNCAGGICANSTYSWLGGFFQGERRGKIFMPSVWLPGRDCRGVYPPWANVIDVGNSLAKDNKSAIMDIVIPVGPNDISIIREQIKYTKVNIIGYRNIYLIFKDTSLQIDGCITILEDIFPFNKNTIAQYHGKSDYNGLYDRKGWYLQQLLKLYAGNIIPGILDTYLVIDSDTFFLKPTRFEQNGKWLYCFGIENHRPYFEHMAKLHPSFVKMDIAKSGICHHMIFEKKYLNELFKIIETRHGAKFFEVFLKMVTLINGSGASEYELYFNYMLKWHPNEILIRPLKWQNVTKLTGSLDNDYESVHWYRRA